MKNGSFEQMDSSYNHLLSGGSYNYRYFDIVKPLTFTHTVDTLVFSWNALQLPVRGGGAPTIK